MAFRHFWGLIENNYQVVTWDELCLTPGCHPGFTRSSPECCDFLQNWDGKKQGKNREKIGKMLKIGE